MKALIVDDDRTLADVISFTMRRAGYEVILAEDGDVALKRWLQEQPDLIILDINLPKMDGFTVCQRIREQSDIPIILLTVRGEEEDIVHGLEIGADDYITKPFSPAQLVARARAILRRAKQSLPASCRQIGDLHLDLNRHELTVGEKETIQLTPLEHRLLDCLMVNVGQIVTSEIIIDYVWGPTGGDMDMLRQLVHRLRTKIGTDESAPVYIENIPGLGYGLVETQKKN